MYTGEERSKHRDLAVPFSEKENEKDPLKSDQRGQGTGKNRRGRGIRARWTCCWDLFRLAGAFVRFETALVEENNAQVDREKGQKGGVGASFAPLEISLSFLPRLDALIVHSKRINDHPTVTRFRLETKNETSKLK